MGKLTSRFGVATYLHACLIIVFAVGGACAVLLVNRSMRAEALSEAHIKAKLLLDRNLAMHEYFTRDLKPNVFALDKPNASPDEFDPTWMSSTYAVRKIHDYAGKMDESKFYYKECAINARCPSNEAKDYEKAFIKELNADSKLIARSEVRTIDDSPYLVTLRRGEVMGPTCLRCHDTPQRAPKGLVDIYGPDRSFGRKDGEVVSAISTRIPLAEAYARADKFTWRLSWMLLVVLLGLFGAQYVISRRLLIVPFVHLRDMAVRLASGKGRQEPGPVNFTGKESDEIADAFESVAGDLRRSRDELEYLVQQRTADLEEANRHLCHEIAERTQAEAKLRASEDRFREFVEGSDDLITQVDRDGNFTYLNHTADDIYGLSPEDCVGKSAFSFIHPDDRDRTRQWFESLIARRAASGRIENRQVSLGGDVRHVLWTCNFHYDEKGELPQVNSIGSDITERKINEEDLKKQRWLLSRAQDLGRFGTWSLDVAANQLIWTEEAYRIFGLPVGMELTYDIFLGCIPVDDRMYVDAKWRAAMAGEEYDIEHRIMVGDQIKWVREKGELEFDDEGNCIFGIGFVQDITARKEAEQKLAEREQYYRTLMYSLHEDIVVIDREYRITDVNNSALRTLGLGRDEVIGRHCYEVSHHLDSPCDEHGEECGLRRVFDTGEPYSAQHEHVRADGRKVHVDLLMSPMKNEHGEILHVVEAARNVTNLIEAEKAAADLARFPSEDPSPILRIAADGTILYANAASKSLLIALDATMDQPAPEAWRELNDEALASASAKELEIRHDQCVISFEIVPVVEAQYVNWYGRDVTERKRIQEIAIQTEKMVTVGGLAAGIAHEINNPLAVIVQGAQSVLMLMDPEHSRNVEWADARDIDFAGVEAYLEQRGIIPLIQKIRESGRQAADIVKNMLQYSRPSDSGCLPADLGETLDQAVELAGNDYDLKKKFGFREIEIERQYDPDLPYAECVKTDIQQVFLNLLVNAAHSLQRSKSQTPHITLRTRREGQWACIEVQDNGAGMSEDVSKQIFEPFFTTKDVGEGTGLGLFVAYFIITNNHMGTIDVQSRPGHGAKFTIRLPLASANRVSEKTDKGD